MRLVVVSDSHGDRAILEQLQAHYQGQTVTFLHCGDSELQATDPLFKQMLVVQGNMDWPDQFPEQVTPQINELSVFMTHGHRYGVNFDLTQLLLAGQAAAANLILYGHTHQLACESHQDVLLLNPGSIAQPRGQFQSLGGTYAVIDVTDTHYQVQYYNRQFEPVPQLKFNFKR